MHVLGISCYYHDSAAALLQNGQLIAAAEEERFTRKKHDFDFPSHAINFCLDRAGIEGPELDYVVFYEKPLLKFERILMTCLARFPQAWGIFREAMIVWFNDKLWIKSEILEHLGIPDDRLLFTEHHISHAASTFFSSPFDEAALVTVDGVGEWATTTIGQGTADWGGESENLIEIFDEIQFPHSLGLFYSAFTAFLGFRVNNGEYKVMGMAPYGEPRYLEEVQELLHLQRDGSFRLNMDYFSYDRSTKRTFSEKFTELFGPPRQAEADFFTSSTHPGRNKEQARQNQRYADIAASAQRITEDAVLGLARAAHERTGSKRLCMAGGVALNSVANGRVIRETPFEEVFIQPAAGDAGGALGAALYAWHVLLNAPRSWCMEHVYWGPEHDEEEMRCALMEGNLNFERMSDNQLSDRVSQVLAGGEVVGWYRGRTEWGPRALGNRSILADPRDPEMKEIVNTKIKYREPFRPFAPVVPADRADEYFDIDLNGPARRVAPYMLMVADVLPHRRQEIPAVTHENGTGRLQSVCRKTNPVYYDVITKFGDRTGTPVLLNTSFNLRGEPIVNTPAEAVKTFQESGLDLLVLGPFLARKS